MYRLCAEPRCPDPATYRGRCQRHARARDRSINRAGRRVYGTKRWRLLRRKKLLLNPVCERCEQRVARDVHHKHGVEQDPWSLGSLEALCVSCHSKTTRQEQIERMA